MDVIVHQVICGYLKVSFLKTEQIVNNNYNTEDITKDYIVIENRVQNAGYAKRPEGSVISRIIIKNKSFK